MAYRMTFLHHNSKSVVSFLFDFNKKNDIGDIFKSCQTILGPPTLVRKELRGCVLQTDISFTKVHIVHRVIKVVVKNPNFKKKELRELSDLFQSAGSRTLFDQVLRMP